MVEERLCQLLESTTTREEATERITEIFDTTQPTDSLTGTPPLQSRTTERRGIREQSDSRTQTEAATESRTEADIGTISHLSDAEATTQQEDSREKSEATSREERKSSGTLAVLEIAAGAIIALFMLWLLLTVGKAIKTFIKPD